MTTSWQDVANWYDRIVGEKGHYFHEHIIFPNLLPLLALNKHKSPKLLDLGCGQGVLQEVIPPKVLYHGLDAAPSLIQKAKKRNSGTFQLQDVTEPFSLPEKHFTHITIILALQNMASIEPVLRNAKEHLAPHGKIFIVLNHPCFRIPRQSSWGVDPAKKVQYRRLDRYLTPMAIPIQANPSQKEQSVETLSFHAPLSTYINALGDLKLGVSHMEEWSSDKLSMGKLAKMENVARAEFPLFLLLVVQRIA